MLARSLDTAVAYDRAIVSYPTGGGTAPGTKVPFG